MPSLQFVLTPRMSSVFSGGVQGVKRELET
jgi:hypothetical protein